MESIDYHLSLNHTYSPSEREKKWMEIRLTAPDCGEGHETEIEFFLSDDLEQIEIKSTKAIHGISESKEWEIEYAKNYLREIYENVEFI